MLINTLIFFMQNHEILYICYMYLYSRIKFATSFFQIVISYTMLVFQKTVEAE